MASYEMVIGLEVHCQLGTKTKLFCGCGTDGFGAAPNSRVCPVCTGQPGVLPVLNKRAVELAFTAGTALGCKLRPESIFARKNYFYPDLPKAYQISQYEEPFAEWGKLGDINIRRIHMEEDAGKLLHAVGSEKLDCSYVDFNRGGIPLIEIVTEPDFRTSDQAYEYLTKLKEILQYAGVSRCDMEKGEMRCDANVSIRPVGQKEFGTRAEIKNLNSFKNVKDAIEHEFVRQAEILDGGGKIVQETRLYDADTMRTRSMRSKEEAHDYRYFPDPDLVPLKADPEWVTKITSGIELPEQRRTRFISEFQLSSYDAGVLVSSKALSDNFIETAKLLEKAQIKTLANLMLNTKDFAPIKPSLMAELTVLASSVISVNQARELYPEVRDTGKAPKALVAERGMAQVSDEGAVRDWVKQAIASNPKAVEDIKAGKGQAVGSIVGAVMKLSKGKANPALVNKLIKETLN
jgi:aspartyl-tRNA(Asn)/glutamyl-tRNA(Gln) amidotransferase subunit B